MQSISDVLIELDKIIHECKQLNSRIGYFASLYRRMTAAVLEGVHRNHFDDATRMEKLDVIFAKRFTSAYYDYRQQKPVTKSWLYVFDKSNDHMMVLQRLLLGINTHINLDLGIAAAQSVEGYPIASLQSDFDKINDTISSLLAEVQTDLGEVCYPMRLMKRINMRNIDTVINFSVSLARKSAWIHAVALHDLRPSDKESYINKLDYSVLQLAKLIANPSWSTSLLIKSIQWWEEKSKAKNIDFLNS